MLSSISGAGKTGQLHIGVHLELSVTSYEDKVKMDQRPKSKTEKDKPMRKT